MSFEEMKSCVDQLSALLADPQPGLATWRMCVYDLHKQLAEAFYKKAE